MDSRRDFLKKVGALSLATGAWPASVQRAFSIEPEAGTTFYDAEHVVILMQENRSFDHAYGSLRGVRGFNDPRAVTLPGGNPVWLQTNAAGQTYPPFRLDIKGSKSTWLGCLPHNWGDQTYARNGGLHDRWLDWKQSGNLEYAQLPLTMGFHNREDIPFYYALADAFTLCDQNFCSSLTGTTPNRLHLWSGTIRAEPKPECPACVRNDDADQSTHVSWKTFPERLEELGISWCVYQNEIDLDTGLATEGADWLANFGDNPLEYCTQYRSRFCRTRRGFVLRRAAELQIALNEKIASAPEPMTDAVRSEIDTIRTQVDKLIAEMETFSDEAWERLSDFEKAIHRKAFLTNEHDPHYRELEEIRYQDGDTERTMRVPKGDLFHQFREDVNGDKLPAVSWMVAPRVFSDHPDSPWYGAWYISEVIDILTSRPEVWKKTIFILCYDENDGYFDHMPSFVPPDPANPDTGKASDGIDLELEHVRAPQEEVWKARWPDAVTATGPIGLGYRVPLLIASPWSRGGYVCSEVFDHTSILQFLENFLTKKTGKPVAEPNITPWRRMVCGDLTSAFRSSEQIAGPLDKVERDPFLQSIHQAGFKPMPAIPTPLAAEEIAAAQKDVRALPSMPRQEPGTRPACALPYELASAGTLNRERNALVMTFASGNAIFGDRAAGAPFHVYAPGAAKARAYSVKPGDRLEDAWALSEFPGGIYDIRVLGPNGFHRVLRGDAGETPGSPSAWSRRWEMGPPPDTPS
ncbi:MAG: phospholipase C, phosphocholine-specific [Verrucomicrobia bacterium]|nr:phospholipase C, phosphocholine-specific [Verrucomicrobiota bacterium]